MKTGIKLLLCLCFFIDAFSQKHSILISSQSIIPISKFKQLGLENIRYAYNKNKHHYYFMNFYDKAPVYDALMVVKQAGFYHATISKYNAEAEPLLWNIEAENLDRSDPLSPSFRQTYPEKINFDIHKVTCETELDKINYLIEVLGEFGHHFVEIVAKIKPKQKRQTPLERVRYIRDQLILKGISYQRIRTKVIIVHKPEKEKDQDFQNNISFILSAR